MFEEQNWIGIEENFYEKIKEEWAKAQNRLKRVNILATGKTGAGKSTLINAIFRKKLAEASVGRPVTSGIQYYEIPDLPIGIYDTKGLELGAEAQNESVEAIKNLIKSKWETNDIEKYIHAIWYCVNAGTNRVEETELNWIKELCSLEQWGVPVIVVVTQPFRKSVAKAIKETIEKELYNHPKYEGCHIVLAEADEEDPVGHPAFGLKELVEATFRILPTEVGRSFINAQGVDIDAKVRAAKEILKLYIVTAAATGAAPIPMSDAPLLIANEIAMCTHITVTFGINLEKGEIANIVMALIGIPAVTVAGKTVVSGILKLIPGPGTILGGLISGGTAALLTAALGRTYIAILEMIARGELKRDDLGTDATNTIFRDLMKAELKKKTKDVE